MANKTAMIFCSECSAAHRGVNVMYKAGDRREGFSAGKAVIGAALIGPVGLAAGAFGKKKTVYYCPVCGHTEER